MDKLDFRLRYMLFDFLDSATAQCLYNLCHLLSKLFNSKLQLTFPVFVPFFFYAALPVRIVDCCDLIIKSNIARKIRSPITWNSAMY